MTEQIDWSTENHWSAQTPEDPALAVAAAVGAHARSRATLARHALLSPTELEHLIFRVLHGPRPALNMARSVIRESEERRSDAQRLLENVKKERLRLEAERQRLAGQAPTADVVAYADEVARGMVRASEHKGALARALEAAWPEVDVVLRGAAAVGRAALRLLAQQIANALDEKLFALRRDAGAVLATLDDFDRERASIESVTQASLMDWQWSSQDRDLVRRVAALATIGAEPRRTKEATTTSTAVAA